jgi:hypothetical protein
MTTTAVKKHFDVFEQVRCGVTVRPVARDMDSFVLQAVEEALRRHIDAPLSGDAPGIGEIRQDERVQFPDDIASGNDEFPCSTYLPWFGARRRKPVFSGRPWRSAAVVTMAGCAAASAHAASWFSIEARDSHPTISLAERVGIVLNLSGLESPSRLLQFRRVAQ